MIVYLCAYSSVKLCLHLCACSCVKPRDYSLFYSLKICALRAAGGTSLHDLYLMESTGLSGVFKEINKVCYQVHDFRGQEMICLGSCALPTVFVSE